ncbi:unnamed protein product [Bursaphelenchus xylophilus]|nr:unnamed protein product [Bursaphelenchus xylophilus]CAG9093343.1 unnamed protein product [Bursaphelenchus xylophilus]
MKVFTVGMDQKPPIEKAPETPPPSYHLPTAIPMGPEIPQPIIVRKSRGYKGILLVMLGVFLMAVFALVLNEMAYNRQRDENFFRLQWAQMRHRFGYPPREFGERIIPEVHGPEMQRAEMLQQKTETTTPSVREDKFLVDNELNNSEEKHENEGDARLQFLKRILQKIKQNAEEMGLQGTMQVSVVEVEPQQLPEFIKSLRGQPQERHFGPSEDPRSDAFLDSFGEFHAPNPFNGQPMESRDHQQPRGRIFGPWTPDEEPIFRPEPEMMRPPPIPDWALQRPEMEIPEFNHEFPKSGEINPQEVMGEMYGRRFGRILQDLIAARLQSRFMQQPPPEVMNPLMSRPSFPIEQQPQAAWWGMEQPHQPQPQVEAMPPQMPQMPQQAWPQPPQFQQFPVPQENQVQQQAQQAQQVLHIQPEQPAQPPQGRQVQQDSAEGQPPAIQPPRVEAQQQAQPQFRGFPQPTQQFPVFFPTEERQAQWPQQPEQPQPPQNQPQPTFNQAAPAGWTHQAADSEPHPSLSTVVDGEVEKKHEEVPEASPELIVLHKAAPVDAQPLHEDSASSQLSDLPFKELQGELAAAAAALAQQHEAMLEQQREEEAQAFLQAKEESAEIPKETKTEEKEKKVDEQHPVDPSLIQSEQQNEDHQANNEQVDFPAVRFPQADQSAPTERQHADAEPHIFFQVDEPQPNFGAGHV